MFPIFSKSKKRAESPEKLFFFLDKIINICIIKIERGEIKSSTNILKDLDLFLHQFWSLKQKNPGRFLSLVASQEIYEKACPIKMPGHFYEEHSFDTQCADNLKVQNLLHSHVQAGKELKGFGRLLSGFEKIWESSLHYDQPEVSSAIFQILDRFLKTLLEKPFNDLFVESLLKVYQTILEKLLKSPENSVHEYAVRYSLLWYQKYVLNRESLSNPFLNLGYEELLDNTFYKMMISIINASNKDAFSVFLGLLSEKTDSLSMSEHSLLDIFHILEKGSRSQYNYFKSNHFFMDKIDLLHNEIPLLETFPKRRDWLEKKEELFSQIRPHLEASQLPHFQEIEDDIQNMLLHHYRKQKTLELIVAVIAYSLIRNKPMVQKEIFTFYLPYDVYHTWFTDFIIPKNLTELMLIVNKKDDIVAKYTISEGLRVTEPFYNKAFLIILSSFLVKGEMSDVDFSKPREVKSISLPGTLLNSIRCDLSSLLLMAHDLSREANFLHYLDITDNNHMSHWKNKMIPFLTYLVSLIDQQVFHLKTHQKMSETKQKDFIDAIFSNYQKNTIFRKLYQKMNRLSHHPEIEVATSIERLGLNVIDDKAQFLENWENSCSLQVLDYGVKLALSEDVFVFNQIRRKCQSVSWDHLREENVKSGTNDYIMITTDLSYQNVILKMENFSPTFDRDDYQDPFVSLWGEFTIYHQTMPIIVLPHVKDEEGILILSKESPGTWHQYVPLNPTDDPSLLHEFLYINLQAFSEHSPLLEEYLKNPPAWLKELGSSEKQKAYLEEHILIHIFERFQ